jgi:3-oxoadipate enol-lactonase
MGGMIAQELSLRSPSKVASLVLGCTTHGGREATPPPVDFLKLCGKWVKSDFSCKTTQKELGTQFIRFCSSPEFENQPGRAKMFEKLVDAFMETPRTPEGLLNQLGALAKFNSTKELGNISSPTLVVHGTEDVVVPYANGVSLSKKISNAELLEWSNAGHFFWIHEPVDFIKKLNAFLDKHDK